MRMPGRLQRFGERLPPWLQSMLIGLVSRGFSVAILLASSWLHWPTTGFRAWSTPFVIWDGEWYLWIASHGYHAEAVAKTAFGPGYHDFAFWPAWPLLIQAVSLNGTLSMADVGPILADVIFILACVPIGVVLRRVAGPRDGRWALVLFAFNPAGYIYSIPYTEPLFLFCSGLALAMSKPGRSAVAAMLAQITRATGGALAFAAIPDLFSREHRVRGVLTILGCVVVFAAWWTWIALLTHDPFGYMLGTPSWWLNQGPTAMPTGIASLLDEHNRWVSITTVPFLLLLAAGTFELWRRRELRLAFFCIALLGSTVVDRTDNMARLAASAFPAFAGVSIVLRSDRRRWLVLLGFMILQVAYGAAVEQRHVVP
jgi:hypothetical protein